MDEQERWQKRSTKKPDVIKERKRQEETNRKRKGRAFDHTRCSPKKRAICNGAASRQLQEQTAQGANMPPGGHQAARSIGRIMVTWKKGLTSLIPELTWFSILKIQ